MGLVFLKPQPKNWGLVYDTIIFCHTFRGVFPGSRWSRFQRDDFATPHSCDTATACGTGWHHVYIGRVEMWSVARDDAERALRCGRLNPQKIALLQIQKIWGVDEAEHAVRQA